MTVQPAEIADDDLPKPGTIMVIYCRTATIESDLDRQELHLRRFAERHCWHIRSAFHDQAQSGMSRERDGLRRLCSQVLHPGRPFNHILTTTRSRISRDMAHYNELVGMLLAKGVHLVFSDELTNSGNNGHFGDASTIFESYSARREALQAADWSSMGEEQ